MPSLDYLVLYQSTIVSSRQFDDLHAIEGVAYVLHLQGGNFRDWFLDVPGFHEG